MKKAISMALLVTASVAAYIMLTTYGSGLSAVTVFAIEGECEKSSGSPCEFQTCDYNCPSNFKKGWVGVVKNIEETATEIQQLKAPAGSQASLESEVIEILLSSWKTTQNKLFAKAGESGAFNPPGKIQFISSDTVLVHYDDGLVDHVSVLRIRNDSFVEVKNVGVMATVSQAQWQDLLNTYGDPGYQVSNYQSSDYKIFSKVSDNVLVR